MVLIDLEGALQTIYSPVEYVCRNGVAAHGVGRGEHSRYSIGSRRERRIAWASSCDLQSLANTTGPGEAIPRTSSVPDWVPQLVAMGVRASSNEQVSGSQRPRNTMLSAP